VPVALAPVAAYTIAVLAPGGSDDGCPSPRQVNEALVAHLGGTVAPFGQPPTSTTLRLTAATDPAGSLRLDLTDPAGGPLLHRVLPPREHARDCPALAETAALIVDRYWHEVGYDVPLAAPRPPPAHVAPPPPPDVERTAPPKPHLEPEPGTTPTPIAAGRDAAPEPASNAAVRVHAANAPPGWFLGAGVGAEVADTDKLEGDAAVQGGFETPFHRGRLGFRFSAGALDDVRAGWSTGHATFLQFPVRVGAYWPLSTRLGQIEPGIGLDVDAIVGSVTDPIARTLVRISPAADVALGWSVWFSNNIYIRATGTSGVGVPYRFVTFAESPPIWQTPRVRVDLALEFGVWFP
jgi:hypothetical protein